MIWYLILDLKFILSSPVSHHYPRSLYHQWKNAYSCLAMPCILILAIFSLLLFIHLINLYLSFKSQHFQEIAVSVSSSLPLDPSIHLGLRHSAYCIENLSPHWPGTCCKASPVLKFVFSEPNRMPGEQEVTNRGFLRREQEFQDL